MKERGLKSASACMGADAEIRARERIILYHPDEVPPDIDGAGGCCGVGCCCGCDWV